MKAKLVTVAALTMMMFGCSSSPEKTEDTYIGVGNVEYDSLYHFGYNTGCRYAGQVKQDPNLGDVESMKDETLDGLSQFDNGWDAGTKACEDGVSRSMYTVSKQ
ncbi:hypothetical protein [Shewanella sp. Isolate11]|uniref:hypothetical protein n=1 Tax=Shewanella sp. Isolate11 TaxID=2908530 RepID=UPI001EFD1B12|nr:hypothetical protein [Shewanella sp. Isolate11]MCG9697758.1 hypothetical protein [Shewanella sp. Isolate11]